MANENCLAGLRCPNPDCGSFGPFRIAVCVIVEMGDDGCEPCMDGDLEWEETSYCQCVLCSDEGRVADYTLNDEHPWHHSITCILCGQESPAGTAHRHQNQWIGEECWDERLRSSE
jgi:hypothetical protein